MSTQSYRLKEALLAHLAEVMLQALKDDGGIYPTEKEYYELKEAFMSVLQGKLRI